MILGIDLGTTNCKSAVFEDDLTPLAQASAQLALVRHSAAEIEQDAEEWWSSVVDTARRALAQVGARRTQVRAVSVSAQGIAVVPVGRNGAPLKNAISWLDTRAREETAELVARYGEDALFQRTGKRPSSLYTLPKLLWLKRRRPDIYDAAWKCMLPMDYILYKLTGRCVTDHTMAAGTMLYDIEKRAWMEDVLGAAGLDREKLPDIARAGTPAGELLPSVARALGLGEHVVAAVGGQDQKCAALGAGLKPGVLTVSLGTGCCVSALCDRPVLDARRRIPCFSYLEADKWVLEGVLSTAAACYDWFRSNFAPQYSFEQLNELAARAEEPAREMFYPDLSGGSSPHWGGGMGAFTRLSLQTNAGSLARAVLEGVAYGIRENIEVMNDLGARAREIRLFGGGARSELWRGIIADVTNLPVCVPSSEETALAGAAMLALRALGEAPVRPPEIRARRDPQPPRVARYQSAYAQYERER